MKFGFWQNRLFHWWNCGFLGDVVFSMKLWFFSVKFDFCSKFGFWRKPGVFHWWFGFWRNRVFHWWNLVLTKPGVFIGEIGFLVRGNLVSNETSFHRWDLLFDRSTFFLPFWLSWSTSIFGELWIFTRTFARWLRNSWFVRYSTIKLCVMVVALIFPIFDLLGS